MVPTTPIYRQLYDSLKQSILSGALRPGDRLAPTRELAAEMGLNRATVSAAYELLEADGLISGQVGRGSFVQSREISFSTSRPSEELFPLEDFRETAEEVIRSKASQILQLGSPQGYGPLRDYLVEEAIEENLFDPATDDLLITSGCQQALDLIQRTLLAPGVQVLTAEPIYPGLRNAFAGRLVAHATPNTKAHIVVPNFANPTGHTMNAKEREATLREAEKHERLLIEVDVYSRLRYSGRALPTLRATGDREKCLLLRSFSKIAFPGLRVGWVIGPRESIRRLGQTKQWTDLHSDQLSQAIMLEFARSGRLDKHVTRVVAAGRLALETTIKGLEAALPTGAKFTRPDGGMNLWVSLPAGCDAEAVLEGAKRAGVSYLPGRHFSLTENYRECFRLSFAGLPPARIEEGLRRLKPLFFAEAERASQTQDPLPAMAMV